MSVISRTIYPKWQLGFSRKPIFMKFRRIDYLIIIIMFTKRFSHFSIWRLDSFQEGLSERDIIKLGGEPTPSCLKYHLLRLQVRFQMLL